MRELSYLLPDGCLLKRIGEIGRPLADDGALDMDGVFPPAGERFGEVDVGDLSPIETPRIWLDIEPCLRVPRSATCTR